MKTIVKISIALILTLIITGCTLPFSKKSYDKELYSIFPKEKVTIRYFGLAEYGHTATIEKINKSRTKITYDVSGYMADARGDEFKKRGFTVKYTLDSEKVVESIKNNDEFRRSDNTLNSIIPDNIILKAPLTVGNKWQQKFVYKGKTYTATTEITKIIELKDNVKHYITETNVSNIKGFFDDEYFESRTYETNKGLISFMNTMELYDIEVDRDLTKEDFIFGYTQAPLEE